MGPIGTVRRSFLAAGYSRGKVKMQLNNVKRVGNDKESLTGLLTVKHGSNQVTESATAKWSSTDKGFKVVSSGVSTIIDGEDSISVVFNMSDLGLEKTMSLSVNNSIDLSSSTSSTSSSDRTVTALSNYNQVTTLLSDVDKNEADADEADAALSARLDVLEADPTTATAVAKVESDGYAVATAAAEREAAADAALSARLDALEASTTTSSTTSIESGLLSGDWTVSGRIFRVDASGEIEIVPNYSTTINITQNSSYPEFLVVESGVSGDGSTRTTQGVMVGLLEVDKDDMILTLVDYDDNGIFTFTGIEKDTAGNIIKFSSGKYLESGFTNELTDALNQMPTVGVVTLEKV